MTLVFKEPAKGYKHVRVVDYATYDENGRLIGLACKLCGTVMGEVNTKLINRHVQDDGRVVEQVETRFRRNSNFAQVTIEMEDGSAHETALCKKCSAGKLKPAVLAELVKADAIEQRWPEHMLDRQLSKKPKSMVRMNLNKMMGAQ